MDSTDKSTLKAHMEGVVAELLKVLPGLKEGAKAVAPDNAIGRLTRVDAMQSQEINKNSLKAAKIQLAALEYALKQLDDPDFGFCVECGEAIPLGRLKAVPGARACVKCA